MIFVLPTVQCGPGTFQSVITKKCEKCPTGTYQPEAGKTTCLLCPEGSIIKGGENKNFTSCKGKVCFYMKTMRLLHWFICDKSDKSKIDLDRQHYKAWITPDNLLEYH